MLRLAQRSIRHPAIALGVCAAVAAALILVASGATGAFSPSLVVVAGTEASRAQEVSDARFGPSVLVPILLEGPADRLDREGPAVVRALAARPDTRVLSAWDRGEIGRELRPDPGAAMIVASIARTEREMVDTHQAQIEATVERWTTPGVAVTITGQPTLDQAFQEESVDATRRGVLIAMPVLFVLLLAMLRAPVIAAGLTLLGGAVAFSGLGLLTLLGEVERIDAIAMVLGTMTGFALAVGYGLMVVRRWRDEIEADASRRDAAGAAATAIGSTGRAVLAGGTAVAVALILATLLGPLENLTSLGLGALLCAILATGAAVVAVPAALVLLGERALWLSFPPPAPLARAWDRIASGGGGWVVRNAIGAGAVATALLLALAIPALSLPTGPPSAELLPADSEARTSFEHVAEVMGPGWPTPFNVVVHSPDRPLTSGRLLRRLERFQERLAEDPRVASVTGPGLFAAVSRDLGVLPAQLKDSAKLLEGGREDLGELADGLGQAGDGARRIRAGLSQAAGGAGRLAGGSGQAQSGAGRLRAGLGQAQAGAEQVSAGLEQALAAARQLRDGAGQALAGSRQLTQGLGQASGPVKAGLPVVQALAADVGASAAAVKDAQASATAVADQLAAAAARLRALPPGPETQAAIAAIEAAQQSSSAATSALGATEPKLSGAAGVAGAFADQVAQLSDGLERLHAGSSTLSDGIGRLQDGNRRLADGIGKLSGGGGRLAAGVGALRDGAAQLEAGLGALRAGAGALSAGLAGGVDPTGRLVGGLGEMQSGVADFRSNLPSTEDLERLQRESPGLFDSGYFVLSALDGARAGDRNQAQFAVNLDRGGTTGQITVISRTAADSAATQQLGEDLKRRALRFGERAGVEVAVGGPAGQLGDFADETSSRILPVVVAVAIAIGLLLMVLLRSVVMPAVAVAFDLLVAAATFGAMALLFGGDDPLLGGPGYVDPLSIIAAFAAVFGITMVFEVQLLHRTREAYVATGDAAAALRTGMRATALAGTGAALAMVAAIVPFAISELVVVRQIGVGAGVAILLDAILVRPVLLPAAVAVLGRASWWPVRPAVATDRDGRFESGGPPATPLTPATGARA